MNPPLESQSSACVLVLSTSMTGCFFISRDLDIVPVRTSEVAKFDRSPAHKMHSC